ncbi:MAG: DUF4838 domain-containing protein, partial [Thermoguttaceae bacterium]|nr:DUF4838 domain-containing protein [Thermoguttaceae bacterium]
VIGPSALSKTLLSRAGAEDETSIGNDGIILQTVGQSMVLSGHPDRGALYAVYTFLEDIVGIRWWTDTESTIPHQPTLEVPPLSTRYEPPILWRDIDYLETYGEGESRLIFSARRKLNSRRSFAGAAGAAEDKFGFSTIASGLFYQILPPGKYFDEHPDWYSLNGGKRSRSGAQLCLTNEEMREEFIRQTLEKLRKNPEIKVISIAHNDNNRWCECPECRKLVEENGSQAGPLLDFLNPAAQRIEEEFPDVVIETLAYRRTRCAPKVIRPRDNIRIRFCTIEGSYLTPFSQGTPNQSIADDLKNWRAISKQLTVWDYVTNFSSYMLPHPNLQVLSPNIRLFAENHVDGVFLQGDQWCSAGDFVRMRCYILSKLLWDPTLDQRALEDEFLAGYYSPKTAEFLRQYLDLITETALRSNIYLRCYMNTSYYWLDTPALAEATERMNRAIAAAREDEERSPEHFAGLAEKVRRESIPVRLAWLRDWPDRQCDLARLGLPSPVSDGADYFEEFRELLKASGVSCAVEGKKSQFGGWMEILQKVAQTEAIVPEEVQNLPDNTWYDLEEYGMNLGVYGKYTFLEDDAAAENGRAVRITGDHHEWVIGWETSRLFALESPSGAGLDEKGNLRVRVILRARCQAADGDDGSALTIGMGLYDGTRAKDLFRQTLTTTEMGKDQYRSIDLGTVSIRRGTRLWIAPTDRPEAVQNLYVDRIIFIRE